ALYPAAFAVVTRWAVGGRQTWRWVWLAAIAWTGLEYLRSAGVLGFPWALLGLTQHRSLPVLQVARYAGVYGVSFLVALAGVSLAGVGLIRRPAPIIFPVLARMLANGGGIRKVHTVGEGPVVMAVSRYDKVRLVAFGETGILPGTRYEPLWTPVGRVGVAICFESIFPDVTRELVRNGAQVLAVMTNDAWFDGTAGPAQHAVHAVLRAVESGRWVVRAANTGLSMVIDPAGRVRVTLSPRQSGVLISRAGLVDAPTFYASRGDVLVGAGLV